MRSFLVLIGLFCCTLSFAQDKKAEKYIRDLTAPEFYGRGYTHNADKLAANYIRDKFKEFGLKPLAAGESKSDPYFQPFRLNVNTFPENVIVIIDGDTLATGADFIVDPQSGSANGTFGLLHISPKEMDDLSELIRTNMENVRAGKLAFVINASSVSNKDSMMTYYALKYELADLGPVIWINNEKLTWSIGREAKNYPIIEIADSLVNENVDSIGLNINARFVKDYQTQNVIGYVKATTKKGRKRYKVITAHYDHLGQMGNTAYIPGANDNASGTSMLLNLAEYYSTNPPKDFNVVFIAFGAEEAGLLGSLYYTQNPLFPLNKIDFLVNLDLLGTGEEGITVVNGLIHEKEFALLQAINSDNDYVVKIRKRGEAANSDHYYFTKNGVPAFFIYTLGGIKAYHDIYDRSETLPLTEFNDLYKMLIRFIDNV